MRRVVEAGVGLAVAVEAAVAVMGAEMVGAWLTVVVGYMRGGGGGTAAAMVVVFLGSDDGGGCADSGGASSGRNPFGTVAGGNRWSPLLTWLMGGRAVAGVPPPPPLLMLPTLLLPMLL